MSGNASPPRPPPAKLRRARFSFVWLIPMVAAVIAGYLGYRTVVEQGPLLTLSFRTAEGLAAGQTQIKYKAVALGTVESIDLSKDNSHVVVQVRMNSVGARFLTSHARFWVVRPRLDLNDLSGLDTLVSGAFIAVDPGAPGGTRQTVFTGLEQPPGVRSDVPGRTFVLTADNLGSLSTGSPVFYRDVIVGEVLGYDLGGGLGPIKVDIFVHAPYDNLVFPDTRFWNSSGIVAGIRGGVLQVQLQSLQAVLSGGVTFSVPVDGEIGQPAADNSVFPLYASQDEAQSASYQTQIPLISYLTSSVSGLTPGAPVDLLGIQVGDVTGVSLQIDQNSDQVRARVAMRLQPERVFNQKTFPTTAQLQAVFQNLVNHGLRVELGTASYVTGQKLIELTMETEAAPAAVTQEGDALVLPSQAGGLDQTLQSVSDISNKLNQIPFKQIGDHLDQLLLTTDDTLESPQMKQSIADLAATLKSANATLATVNQTYGADSDFERNLQQVLDEANASLRSVRLLADYLHQHPQSLLLGRSGP
jgi:paraquat-inducible protein B